MRRRVLAGLLLTIPLAGCTTMPRARSTLTGRWAPESAELGGQAFPVSNFGGAALRLTAETYEFAGDTGTYTVAAAPTAGGGAPAPMDIRGQAGPNAGRTIPAVYTLAGDRLTIAYQLGPGARPAALTSPAGSQVLVVRYRRAP